MSPITIVKYIYQEDPASSSVYVYSLSIFNPVVSTFNDFAYPIVIIAGILAFVFAYKKTPGLRPARKRVHLALSWASLTVVFGLIGILGSSIGTANLLNFIKPVAPWGLISLSLSASSIVLSYIAGKWLTMEYRKALARS